MTKEEIKKEKKLLKLEKKNEKLNKKNEAEELKLNKYNEDAPKRIKKEKIKKIHQEMNEAPKRSVLEEVGNSVSHGVGAILAIVALIVMLYHLNPDKVYNYNLAVLATIIYTVCMFMTMINSSLYHSWKSGSTVKRVWRRFDYSAIYLLIAGTFAPLFLIFLIQYNEVLAITLIIIQWVFVIFGITMNGVFGPGRIKVLNYFLYFAIGWSGIVFIPFFIKYNQPLLWYILIGGLTYTLGMIPFAFKKFKATHFVFHLIIVISAIIQWAGIFICLYL